MKKKPTNRNQELAQGVTFAFIGEFFVEVSQFSTEVGAKRHRQRRCSVVKVPVIKNEIHFMAGNRCLGISCSREHTNEPKNRIAVDDRR